MSQSSGQSLRARLTVWLPPLWWVVVLVLCVRFFAEVSTILLGALAASIIACTLQPLMRVVPGPRAVRVAAAATTLLLVAGAAVLALWSPLAEPLNNAIENWPTTRVEINKVLAMWSQRLGLSEPLTVEKLWLRIVDFVAGTGGEQVFSVGADLLLGVLIALAFTIIGSVFLLTDVPEALTGPMGSLLSGRQRDALHSAFAELAPRYRRWVLGTLTGMTVVFLASALGYTLIGLRFAIPLALVAGLAEVVPTVGPAIACLIATLFAAAIQGPGKAVAVLIVYGVIQALEAYVILPVIMRGAVNIHPAVTLFTVILWGKIFGLPGLMLAIPINLTIWTLVCRFVEASRGQNGNGGPAPAG